MEDETPIEKRFTALEIKASFAEDLIDQLNLVIVAQQQQLERLSRELAQLQEQQRAQRIEADPTAFRSLREDLPPHY